MPSQKKKMRICEYGDENSERAFKCIHCLQYEKSLLNV
jgi:hypothetical protein